MTQELDAYLSTMVGHPVGVATTLAEDIVRTRYGLEVRAERLTGERDENFRMTARDGGQYVFKIANANEDPWVTKLPTAALLHIEAVAPDLPCPRVLRSTAGETQIAFTDRAGLMRTGSLVTHLPGKPLRSVARSARQRAACGRVAARMGQALKEFDHPAARRPLIWDVRVLPKLRPLLADLPGLERAGLISEFMDEFATSIAPRVALARQQFIHNDLNSGNVLVAGEDTATVSGIIDFGDAIHSALIVDVSIAAVAQITENETAIEDATDLVRAYHTVEPLLPAELGILPWLIAARMVMGIVIPAWHRANNPGAEHFAALSDEHRRKRFELIRSLTALKAFHV